MIIPRPASLARSSGTFAFTGDTTMAYDPDAATAASLLRAALSPAGVGLSWAPHAPVELRLDPGVGGREGYRLVVQPDLVRLTAATQAGLFYGVQTIRQLLPPLTLEADPPPGIRWELPCVEIDDVPRFAWRGVMLDVARHFMPRDFVCRLLDLMALHKLNVLHLHLTDDQGWRFAVQRYPLLTGIGASRRETVHGGPSHVGWPTDGRGGYYSQEEAREIVAYAAARHIDVVPEIEMPGHAQAAIAAYPWLGNDPDQRLSVWDSWGISENILNVEESTIEFCQQVLDEVMAVFPSRYVHIGGDECPTVQWRESAAAQARIRELGLTDESELRPWFIGRMREHVARDDRRLICWDEPKEIGLDPSVIRMSWLEEDAGWRAARAGHDVVMTPWTATYFDLYQSQDGHAPPAQKGLTTLEDAYAYEPLGDAGAELARHVLGTQCQFWTEYMPTPRHVEYMAFPRTSAFAEVAWSPAEKDYPDFLKRLRRHLQRLDALRVAYHALDDRATVEAQE